MQQNNYIKNRLKELEAQQEPDMSHLEEHWQQMSSMLQPAAVIPTKSHSSRNIITVLVLAVMVLLSGGIFLYLSYTDHDDTNNTQNLAATTSKKITGLFIPDIKRKETIIVQPKLIQRTKKTNAPGLYLPGWDDSDLPASADTLFSNVKISFTACTTCPVKNGEAANNGINRQALLQSLFEQVAKPAQKFLINNSKDSFLFASEGTVVFIPAGAFGSMDSVTVSLSEYYDYPDMILNKLVTKSGDRQLISGGMINIEAEKNGKQISLAKNNSLKVFIPGISAQDSFMVFNGIQNNGGNQQTIDHAVFGNAAINWQLSTVSIDSAVIKMFIRAIDLRDNLVGENYVWWGANKTKAVFTRSRESVYSKAELKEILKKKYGDYYDKIVVRNQWKRNLFFKKVIDIGDEEYYHAVYNSYGVGDTAELSPMSMKIYKLEPIDTVYRAVRTIRTGTRKVINTSQLNSQAMLKIVGEKSSINIDKLGWINCDKFNNNSGPKNDLIVDIKDASYNYYTVMIFDKYKSILSGYNMNDSQVLFSAIPSNESFKIISIGINKDGKAVYAMKAAIGKETLIQDLQFQQINIPDLKTALSKLEN